ncbi:unnamed protein product [Ceratitis capitata]|uniref:(Mediterranean fruit fly) hypothetical protein n=1 Tax=Ceratitis capitata TaxID=7213 RepID=A0A811U7G7_CERCA|nr:unnamed protein product [Ceratitis capitata]
MHDMDDSELDEEEDEEEEAAIDVEADGDEEELRHEMRQTPQTPNGTTTKDTTAFSTTNGNGAGSAGVRKATPFELLAKSVNCLEMHSNTGGKEVNVNYVGVGSNENGVEKVATTHKVY